MGETDVSFRQLLRGVPRPLLRLAFPRRKLEPLGPIDPSVDRARQRTADNLFRVRDGRAQAAIHVEVEREWKAAIPPRLFEYASVAAAATRLPLSSVVVLLRPGGRPPSDIGVHRIPGIGGDAFVFRYHVVPLWRLDARRMRAQLGLQGAPFCVAMRGSNESFVRELATDVLADRSLAERDRRSTLQLLYIVSAAILGSEAARRIFHMESIIQDPNVQELIREWEDKGRAEGRAEGHALEARVLLHKVLAARSFRVTPDIRKRIETEADVSRLEAWLEAAVTAGFIGDVFRDG
jgi:hypothetical protein